jgi:hypothetical protein
MVAMPLTPGLDAITLTATYHDLGDNPQEGYVVITGGELADPGGQVIFSGSVSCDVEAGAMTPATLPYTDSPWVPAGYAYTITERIGSGQVTGTYDVQLPSTLGTSADLSELMRTTPPPPASAFAANSTWTGTQTFAGNPPIRIPAGSGAGKVLTSDSSGNMTLQSPSAVLSYSQAFSSASVVTVTHNLGKYPSVTVLDSAGDECEGDVDQLTGNQLTVTFSAPFSGTVYCN